MGIELAKAYVSVRGDSTQLPGDLANVVGMVKAALSDARTYAAGLLATFARAGEGFLATGRQMRDSNEQTRTSFETLIGSVSETEDLLKNLTDFAVKTPFEMPQLLQVTQNLLTAGERGEELMDSIKMFGDAAQGQVQKFSILGTVVGVQMKAMGKSISTQSQDFKQLSSQGIISISDMAKYFKKSEVEMRKMQFGVDDVRGALKMLTSEGGRFYKSMEKQSETMIGLTSTLSDAWNIMARGVTEVMGPIDKLILKLKIDLVGALHSIIEATNGVAAGGIVASIKLAKIQSVLLGSAVAARIFGVSIKAAFIGTGIVAIILALNFAIGALTTWFLKSGAGVWFLSKASEGLAKIWANLKEAGKVLIDGLGDGFENLFGVTFPDYMNKWADGVSVMLNWVVDKFIWLSEKIKFVAAGISFLWRNAYELMAIAGIDFVTTVINMAQSVEAIWVGMTNTIGRLIAADMAMVMAMGENIKIFFMGIAAHIRAGAAGAMAAINAIIDGDKSDAEIGAAAKKAYDNSLNGDKKNNPEIEAKKQEYATAAAKSSLAKNAERKAEEAAVAARAKRDSLYEEYQNSLGKMTAADSRKLKDKYFDEGVIPMTTANHNHAVAAGIAADYEDKRMQRLAELETLQDAEDKKNGMKDPIEEGKKAWKDFKDKEIKDPVGKKMKEDMAEAKKTLQTAIDERERLRRGEEEKEEQKEKDKNKNPKKAADTPLIDAGRYGFAQFGMKLQDAILKGKGGDPQIKMVGLLEKGNEIQKQQLEEQKKNKPGLGP